MIKELSFSNKCPLCESNLFHARTNNKKFNRENFACINCKNQWTKKEVDEYEQDGYDEIDGKTIHRLHKRLANILLDGETVKKCKATRTEIELAAKDILEIGLERFFEHLLEHQDEINICDDEVLASVIDFPTNKKD